MFFVTGSMRPIFRAIVSWNQRPPSGPRMRPRGPPCTVSRDGSGYSVMTPSRLMRPIWSAPDSVNHMARSGPATMLPGTESACGDARPSRLLAVVGSGNSAIVPSTPTRPMAGGPGGAKGGAGFSGDGGAATLWKAYWVNQRSPPGPMARLAASRPADNGNVRTVPSGARRPTAGVVPWSVNQTAPSGARISSPGSPPAALRGKSVTTGLAQGSPAAALTVLAVFEPDGSVAEVVVVGSGAVVEGA